MLLAIRPDGVAMSDQCALSPGLGSGHIVGHSSLLLVFRVKGK